VKNVIEELRKWIKENSFEMTEYSMLCDEVEEEEKYDVILVEDLLKKVDELEKIFNKKGR